MGRTISDSWAAKGPLRVSPNGVLEVGIRVARGTLSLGGHHPTLFSIEWDAG